MHCRWNCQRCLALVARNGSLMIDSIHLMLQHVGTWGIHRDTWYLRDDTFITFNGAGNTFVMLPVHPLVRSCRLKLQGSNLPARMAPARTCHMFWATLCHSFAVIGWSFFVDVRCSWNDFFRRWFLEWLLERQRTKEVLLSYSDII